MYILKKILKIALWIISIVIGLIVLLLLSIWIFSGNIPEGGTKIANETAEALNKIVEGIGQAANLVSEIAIASNEQAVGVDQINQGISQIADVVQTTSATSEETAAASEELSSQAEMLKSQIGKFRLRKKGSNSNYGDFGGMNPEVIKMLENMKGQNHSRGEGTTKANKKTITLSDQEFGKY